eukprot:Skav231414  [mRNA]  locus=scaffold4039:126094:128814:- [translate_table: standard]
MSERARYGTPSAQGQVLGGRWKPLHYLYRHFADGQRQLVKSLDLKMPPGPGTKEIFQAAPSQLALPAAKVTATVAAQPNDDGSVDIELFTETGRTASHSWCWVIG